MEQARKEEHLLNACYEPGTMNRKKFIWVFLYISPKEKETALLSKVQNRPASLLNLGQAYLQSWLPMQYPPGVPAMAPGGPDVTQLGSQPAPDTRTTCACLDYTLPHTRKKDGLIRKTQMSSRIS